MANQNLYSGKEYFFLIIDNVGYAIDEPVNWSNILIELIRDAIWYGFSFEFVGGDINLTFKWHDGGGELLEALYDQYKGDAKALLDFGILNSATREQQFLGNLNFNDYEKNDEGITLSVSRVAFESLLRTRFETPVSLNSLTDYDGNVIPALPSKPLFLHSKEIIKFSKAEPTPGFNPAYIIDPNQVGLPANQGGSALKWLQFDTTNLTVSELQTVEGTPLGVSNDDPTTISAYQYKAIEGGFLEITVNYAGWINIENAGANPKSVDFTPFIKVKRGSTIIIEEYQNFLAENVNNLYGASIGRSVTFSVSVIPNDEVYIGLRLDGAVAFVGFMATGFTTTVTFKQLTEAPASLAQGYRIFDVLTRLVYIVTGKNNVVVSDFYNTNGPGEKWFLTNGYAIRNFIVDSAVTDAKPVQISFRELMEGLQMLHNTGTGYGLDNAGNDIIYIGPCTSFFAGGVISELKGIFEYSEKDYKAGTYNEFELGYETYPNAVDNKNLNGGVNTLDEMNTEQTWLTPVTMYKGKLSRKSKLITSGYAIEDIRREQFKASPSTSMQNDDKFFLISYTPDIVYHNISFQFFGSDNSITFDKPVSLKTFDSLTLSGAVLNPTVWTIGGRKDPSGYSFFLQGGAVDETGIGSLSIIPYIDGNPLPAGTVFAERNQNFTIDNLISPASVYNARATPKHAFYEWVPVLNSFLRTKPGTAVIRNTTSKNNGEFTSQFLPIELNPLAVGYASIKENEDVTMSSINGQGFIHMGVTQSLKVQMPYFRITEIIAALRNFTPPLKRLLIVPDKKGKKWLSSINTMKYNPNTETAEFELFKVQAY